MGNAAIPRSEFPNAMKINATWHAKHPMPPHATIAQRAAWHLAHAKHYGCRPIPASVRAHLRKIARRKTR